MLPSIAGSAKPSYHSRAHGKAGLATPDRTGYTFSLLWSDIIGPIAMTRFALIVLLSLSVGIAATGFAAADPLVLRGEVSRGDTIVHQFEHHGTQYEFRMVPAGGGWTVWIGDPAQRDRNYVTAVTPPFRGVNPAVIQGWHFRSADNSGPNKPGNGNVNAPQKERRFAFVLDGAGYQAAREAVEILLAPDSRPAAEIKEAEIRLAKVPRANGVLWIEAMELGNLVEGEQAHIERMAFRIRLHLP